MIKHNYVYNKIWSDYKFKHMNNNSKLLFLYLLTSSHLNIIGIYHLPISYISCDICMNENDVINSINELIKCKIIHYDFENEIILINNFLKYNKDGLFNISIVRSLPKIVSDLPESYLIYLFMKNLKTILDDANFSFVFNLLSKTNLLTKCEHMSLYTYKEFVSKNESSTNEKPFEEKIKSIPVDKIDTSSNELILKENISGDKTSLIGLNLDLDIQETTVVSKKDKAKEKKKELENQYKEKFNQFYSFYPRKENKTSARTNFINLLSKKKVEYEDGEKITADDLIESAKNYSTFCLSHNTESQYIKLPSNFLGRDEFFRDYLPKNTVDNNTNDTVLSNEVNNPYDNGINPYATGAAIGTITS